jgi:hypothetical protein
MDMEDIDIVEDMTADVEAVEREHEDIVLMSYWISKETSTNSSRMRGAYEVGVFD